jgi:RecJ-like exonuclease
MICPNCHGNGYIKIPGTSNNWEINQNAQEKEINCPTCEGDGEISDTPAAKHCHACGEPIEKDQDWCDEHKGAAFVGDRLG